MNSSAMTSQKQNKGEISLDDHSLKVRKPYTISKQRERWTDDEHKKFIEALKLYGRAWRRIEEHVGTKTAVQIRSHAQKFFSKVVREDTTTSDKPIEIPPPRPKRKPMHPYPRKLVLPIKASNLSGPTLIVEQESCSPTSVLSTVGSDSVNVSPNIDEEAIQKLENGFLKENSVEVSSCYRSLKLFGKTMVVKKNDDVSNDVSDLPWFISPRVYSPTPIKPCDKDKETQQEGSSSGSNESMTLDGGSQSLGLSLGNEKKQEKTYLPLRRMNNKKGFLPYKRCLAERDEEMDVQQRLRLCL